MGKSTDYSIKVDKNLPKEPNQFTKFEQAAKEYGCDESEKDFSDKLKKIVQKPKDTKNV